MQHGVQRGLFLQFNTARCAYAVSAKKVKINSFIMYDGVPHRVLEREFTQKGLRPTSLTLILQRISSLKNMAWQGVVGLTFFPAVTKREARFVMQDGDNSLFVPLDTAAEDDDSFDTGFLPENEFFFGNGG